MSILNVKFGALKRQQSILESRVGLMEQFLVEKVEFEPKVVFQSSDGFCLLNDEENKVAPLARCIEHINEHGFLSCDSFGAYSI